MLLANAEATFSWKHTQTDCEWSSSRVLECFSFARAMMCIVDFVFDSPAFIFPSALSRLFRSLVVQCSSFCVHQTLSQLCRSTIQNRKLDRTVHCTHIVYKLSAAQYILPPNRWVEFTLFRLVISHNTSRLLFIIQNFNSIPPTCSTTWAKCSVDHQQYPHSQLSR